MGLQGASSQRVHAPAHMQHGELMLLMLKYPSIPVGGVALRWIEKQEAKC